MENKSFEIESIQPFSKSKLWQFNRDFYQREGLKAWQDGTVPHHLTSNSQVGKTYAEIILGVLRDLSNKKKTTEVVYILEMGAGHGRLAYHVLKHLEKITKHLSIDLPPYCYVLSDIVESSLSFYESHPQFQPFFEKGVLDYCYFDAVASEELKLRHVDCTISKQSLKQPILAIGNYFFDSIPVDLYYIKDKQLSSCSVSLHSYKDPATISEQILMNILKCKFHNEKVEAPLYENSVYNEMLETYKNELTDTHLFFPKDSLDCLARLRSLSKEGAIVISMDKGNQTMAELDNKKEPHVVSHGSFSVWVNYHALGQFCEKTNGEYMFPAFTTFYSQVVCLMLLNNVDEFRETKASYQNNINGFGPDDFNGIKRLTYGNNSKLNLKELIAVIRLSYYDSTFFIKLLPQIKPVLQFLTNEERTHLEQTMAQVWDMYFTIYEPFDLAYEIGGIYYDMGYYRKALVFFAHSAAQYGDKADVFYNQALCHFQLREDHMFTVKKEATRNLFPEYVGNGHLDKLDLESS